MALNYGFGLYSENNPVEKKFFEDKFNALSDDDKTFYHESLPFILMMTDIGTVDPVTIPSIVKRLFVCNRDLLNKEVTEEMFTEHLNKFVGYEANVTTLTTADYAKKEAKRIQDKLPKLTPTMIDEIGKTPNSVAYMKDLKKEDK